MAAAQGTKIVASFISSLGFNEDGIVCAPRTSMSGTSAPIAYQAAERSLLTCRRSSRIEQAEKKWPEEPCDGRLAKFVADLRQGSDTELPSFCAHGHRL